MDHTGVLVHADVDFDAVIPLIVFLGLMHLRIPLPFLVLCGAKSSDQGGNDDRALLHGHAALLEMAFHNLVDEILRSSRSTLRVRSAQASEARSGSWIMDREGVRVFACL